MHVLALVYTLSRHTVCCKCKAVGRVYSMDSNIVRVMSTSARIKERKREERFGKVEEHAMLSLQPRRLGVDKRGRSG
jgi:hypothetical protein